MKGISVIKGGMELEWMIAELEEKTITNNPEFMSWKRMYEGAALFASFHSIPFRN